MASRRHHSQAVVVLAVALALSVGPVARAVEFAGGTGDPNDPYQIATAEQLIGIGSGPNLLDRHFVLVNDIDLDPNLAAREGFTQAVIAPGPVQNDEECKEGRFTGRFDGHHHVIRNLRILADNGCYLGLFGYIGAGGRVENLHLEAAEVSGDSTLGLLAASNGGTISNCTVAGLVQGKNTIGGLVGEDGIPGGGRAAGPTSQPGRIEYCASVCKVRGASYIGGLVGSHARGSVTCSWADCTIDGGMDVGGLIGITELDEVSFCYALGQIAGVSSVGGLIGDNQHAVISGCYAQGEVSGNYAVAGLVAENWDGTVYCSYAAAHVSGKNNAAGLISINRSGVIQLCRWDREVAGPGLSADRESRTTSQMQSTATFDGWGFLGQWTLDDGKDYPRLAWQGLPGEPIRDVAYAYAGGTGEPDTPYRIQTAADLLAVCRYARDWDKHFVLTGDIDLSMADANSLIPIGLADVPFTGVFDGSDHVIKCGRYALPDQSYVALFRYVGRADADMNAPNGIIRSLHLEQVSIVGGDWVAGLVGLNRGLVESCSIRGSLASPRGVAGLVAQNFGLITGCQADVQVFRSDPTVRGLGDAGGLVVYNEGIIRACSAVGSVDGASGAASTGGLVATNQGGEIENSWACAEVNGFWAVGGLVGRASGTRITGCYAGGRVSSSGSDIGEGWAGGLAGSMYGILCSCYATGSVSGNGRVAALVADNGGTIVACYATGAVTGSGTLGGLVADDFQGVVYLSYWDRRTTGLEASDGGTPASTEAMMQAALFRGWGADAYWKIDEGRDYPRLFWEEVPGTPIVDELRSYAGGTGAPDDPYRIETPDQLATIGWYREDFDKCFVLTADLDMAMMDPNSVLPVGTKGFPYTGTFDGADHGILHLRMTGPRGHYQGLFGAIGGQTASPSAGQVRRLFLVDAHVTGRDCVALLAADNSGSIADCRVAGVVEGHWDVGGLVGQNDGGTISRCSSSTNISGDLFTGGLVGSNSGGFVSDSCCRGRLDTTREAGGLAGSNTQGILSNCYSTCDVSSSSSAAGLVAGNQFEGILEHCYFAGRLTAAKSAAGLVLANSTNPGVPTAQQGTLTSCFWDIAYSGAVDGVLDQDPDPAGAQGLATSALQTAATFLAAGWDFDNTWTICEGRDYPRLQWEEVECGK